MNEWIKFKLNLQTKNKKKTFRFQEKVGKFWTFFDNVIIIETSIKLDNNFILKRYKKNNEKWLNKIDR